MAKTYADLTVANATAGNAILASDFATLFTNSNNFRRPPMAQATILSDAAGSGNDVAFRLSSISAVDCTITTGSVGTTIANGGRITIDTPGVYFVSYSVVAGANGAGGRRTANLAKNGIGSALNATGVLWTEYSSPSTANNVTLAASGILTLTQGDYLTPVFYQNSGNNVSWGSVTAGSFLSVMWLGQAT